MMTLMQSDSSIQLQSVLLLFFSIISTCALYIALDIGKNPTVASLIDVTYPLSVALVAYFVFKQNHIDWSVMVGGGLILCGATVIIWKHT